MAAKVSELERCKRASQLFNGANVSRHQLRDVESNVTKSQRSLASRNRAALLSYARSETDISALDAKLREMLKSVNAMYAKSWSRKSAAIMADALVKR